MLLKCNCGTEQRVSIHKDGYEVVKFVCDPCRRKNMILRVSNQVRITMQNGDFFYVKKVFKERFLA